jgi:pantoate--beta-alanine ligase
MVIFKKVSDLKKYLSQQKQQGSSFGFIPTMGALHAGHISLLERATADGMFTICSIFLNPTQFNDKKDYEKYPVSVESDIELLLNAGCKVLFLPPVDEIYPNGPEQVKTYDFGYLDTILEGAKRPGHFKGVGQVVARLLEIVQPDRLYLGRKDYQQCMVISRLKEMMGLRDLQVVVCPTSREPDGLAMSSRNRRLTEPQRAVAGTIYQCLVSIVSKQDSDNFPLVKKQCEDILAAKGFEPEYVALADARNLAPLDNYQKDTPMVALIAARIGSIRLIDNILVNEQA